MMLWTFKSLNELILSIFLGKCLEVEWPYSKHMLKFFKLVLTLYIPKSSIWNFTYFSSSQCSMWSVLNFSHLNIRAIVSHCGFYLNGLKGWHWASLHVLFCHSYFLPWCSIYSNISPFVTGLFVLSFFNLKLVI